MPRAPLELSQAQVATAGWSVTRTTVVCSAQGLRVSPSTADLARFRAMQSHFDTFAFHYRFFGPTIAVGLTEEPSSLRRSRPVLSRHRPAWRKPSPDGDRPLKTKRVSYMQPPLLPRRHRAVQSSQDAISQDSHRLSPSWVLAIILFPEDRLYPLLAPDLVTRSPRMLKESTVALPKISINCFLAFLNGFVVAVVKYGSRHTAKDLTRSHLETAPRMAKA